MLVMLILSLIITPLLYKRIVEIKQVYFIALVWVIALGSTIGKLLKIRINEGWPFYFRELVVWLILHQVFLSLYLVFSRASRSTNTYIQTRTYVFISVISLIELYVYARMI